jgi:hypothetical protein
MFMLKGLEKNIIINICLCFKLLQAFTNVCYIVKILQSNYYCCFWRFKASNRVKTVPCPGTVAWVTQVHTKLGKKCSNGWYRYKV